MAEKPPWGTAPGQDGFVNDRVTAERIRDAAKRECDGRMRDLAERVKQEVLAERAKWLRLVELLDKMVRAPKSVTAAERSEIATLRIDLIGIEETPSDSTE